MHFSLFTLQESHEFSGAYRHLYRPSKIYNTSCTEETCKFPLEFDAEDHIYPTPIKDQGQCSSCWAQAAVSVYEYFVARYFNDRIFELSTQEVVDCVRKRYNPNYNSTGCSGGYSMQALDYIRSRYLETNISYPYIGAVSLNF